MVSYTRYMLRRKVAEKQVTPPWEATSDLQRRNEGANINFSLPTLNMNTRCPGNVSDVPTPNIFVFSISYFVLHITNSERKNLLVDMLIILENFIRRWLSSRL
jgi:hypothetical protein